MNTSMRMGAILLLATLVAAIFAPALAPHPPNEIRLEESLREPRAAHPLGQDRLGRDLAARVVHGARVSLGIGLVAVTISVVAGTGLGILAGLRGGWIDEVIMRVVDVVLAFPGILLAIALAAVLGPGPENVVIALAAGGWTGYARLARAETLSIRERAHVEAARSLGATSGRLLGLHILPLLAPPLAIQATFGLAGAIVAEASLSFLGLGVAPPTPSWGAMLEDGRHFLLVAPHVALVPALAVLAAVAGIHLLGDGLRDQLDPTGG